MSNQIGSKTRSIVMPVPHYEQQYDFSCGPASLMMIFKHFDKRFQLTTSIETDIWRESSLAPLPSTSRYGLAYSALKRGYGVSIITNVKGIEYLNKTPTSLTGRRISVLFEQFLEMMKTQFLERRKRAFEMGVAEKRVKRIGISHVTDALKGKHLSIILTSARFFDDQDFPHWVVITGHDDLHNFYINDPASKPNKGRRVFSRGKFEEINGYYGDQVLISIYR